MIILILILAYLIGLIVVPIKFHKQGRTTGFQFSLIAALSAVAAVLYFFYEMSTGGYGAVIQATFYSGLLVAISVFLLGIAALSEARRLG